jgi:hypothetical protein
MNQDVMMIIIAVIGSSAVWQSVTWFVDRYDKRKKSNEDIMSEVRKVSNQVCNLEKKVDENQAVLARTHILRFADELKNGVHHSNEYFRQQLLDCDTYEQFCKDHEEFKNNYTEMANKYIKDTYQKLLSEGKL